MEFLGIKMNEAVNSVSSGIEVLVSAPDSPVKVVVIPTDEEFMIASDTLKILS
jgi:acetate kinase